MSRLGSVQRKMPCVFVTEVKAEPSAKREHQPFKVLATETLSEKALDADVYNAIATEKVDGTCCYVTNYKGQPYLWARLDRKPNKQADKRFKKFLHSKDNSKAFLWNMEEDFKPVPECWIPAKEIEQQNGKPVPDENGHIPGWVPVEKNSKQYCWHSSVVNYEFGIALVLRHDPDEPGLLEICAMPLSVENICSPQKHVHRHHLGLCWPLPDTYMNSKPVIVNMNLNKYDCAFDNECLFNQFLKKDKQKFDRLKDIMLDV
ncbi:hypothetical protein H671_1g3314 [Cricetulus griseus]|uniref:RNA ligase 1 n=1 Tax=Cricetulus griseus TaxID=10029 RepID=A0A061ILR4_CRIGR|nr:hypothetical protein H671_1g3314 [Cricetulus griseus]